MTTANRISSVDRERRRAALLSLMNVLFADEHQRETGSGDRADAARRMIDASYREKLTMRSLAERLQTPAAPLAKAFHRRFGMTMHSYLTGVRVTRGLELIQSGSKVEAAALFVGYRSRKDFYAAVSKTTGLTPAQFRLHDASWKKDVQSAAPTSE